MACWNFHIRVKYGRTENRKSPYPRDDIKSDGAEEIELIDRQIASDSHNEFCHNRLGQCQCLSFQASKES
ncbi:hypothetical protein I7I53_01752 [Histoplasma capsulatum var. duboisii H88]|uniref:Uncharacterized protein n=1 Tax=Ajellomyces capsulatus (strain H88) TaxID=544711 RepID=A0A8A1LP82_AJEC8|nr:hypothetical protein I7I53_01752 [Histoplasma capsulatum var. duboisii H88]